MSVRRAALLYWQVLALGVQNALVYRWDFLLRVLVRVAPLVATYFIWGAAFEGRESIGGYSYAAMMAYYFSLVVLDSLASPTEDDFQIAADIRDGRIGQILVKPVNYFAYRFSLFVSGRLVYSVMTALPLGVLLWSFRRFFADVDFGATLAPAALACVGSAVLQFSLAYVIGLVAFWLLDVGSIVFMLYSIEFLAGGHIFPLDLLPEPWHRLAMASPFAYEYFFPVAVLLGRIEGAALWQGFAWQGVWIAVCVGFAALAWRLGLRRYTAVGG